MNINTHILHTEVSNSVLAINKCEFYTYYFNCIDVDYGVLNFFKQPHKGMDFIRIRLTLLAICMCVYKLYWELAR